MNMRHHDSIVAAPQYEASISDEAKAIASATSVPHEALASLLEDPESERIALYIPEEWLPTSETPDYQEAYLDAWWHLLRQPDQRADFVDGDIGEQTDTMAPELVVKAAHLTPMLGRAGLVSDDDIQRIIYGTDSSLVRQSFADTTAESRIYAPSTLFDYRNRHDDIKQATSEFGVTPARAAWIYESKTDALVRDTARGIGLYHTEQLMAHNDTLDARIAVAALARYGRSGVDITQHYPWLTSQLTHDNVLVRRQATSAFRHLYHSDILSEDELAHRDVILPTLSGKTSDNLHFMGKEIDQAHAIVSHIEHDEYLQKAFYPVVLLGGSKLKGYGDDGSDTDWALIARPDTPQAAERTLPFGDESPAVITTTTYDNGLAVDAVYANMLYNAAWIGDEHETIQLRSALMTHVSDPRYRRLALRRLEQDSLQYRLLHKGYVRHHAVVADDVVVFADGIDSQSTFWDPGYRRLATQIFAERVTLPKH